MAIINPDRRVFLSRSFAAVAAAVAVPLLPWSRRSARAATEPPAVMTPSSVDHDVDLDASSKDLSSDRHVLIPFSSGICIARGDEFVIKGRPMPRAYRPYRIIVGGTPADWEIADVTIGGHSQLRRNGEPVGVRGDAFSSESLPTIRFHVVQPGMDFVMTATYVGDAPGGAPFVCVALGNEL